MRYPDPYLLFSLGSARLHVFRRTVGRWETGAPWLS